MPTPQKSFAGRPFPAPENRDLPDDPTPTDQAIYVPSVTPGYAVAVYGGQLRTLPTGVERADLNFLDSANGLFRISHVMSSAGQAYKQKRHCLITARRRASSFLICDSGGYQIASRRLNLRNKDRLSILRWMERNADVGMTLDVPTGPLLKSGYAFKSFKDCLDETERNLQLFQECRTPGQIRLLNVLQGNTKQQSDTWYDAVKNYDFEGWAFAGPTRHDIGLFCRRLLKMADDHLLENKEWIHVLGTANLETAVLLTALQRAINRHYNKKLRISFDTSSPFRMVSYRKLYTLPKLDGKRLSMPTVKLPDHDKLIGSTLRWPWPSPLGDRMTLGDFCVQTSNPKVFRDQQSNWYLCHHNLSALCFGIATANRVFDSQTVSGKHLVGSLVSEAVGAIDEVLQSGSRTKLGQYQSTFSELRQSVEREPYDDDRSFDEPTV